MRLLRPFCSLWNKDNAGARARSGTPFPKIAMAFCQAASHSRTAGNKRSHPNLLSTSLCTKTAAKPTFLRLRKLQEEPRVCCGKHTGCCSPFYTCSNDDLPRFSSGGSVNKLRARGNFPRPERIAGRTATSAQLLPVVRSCSVSRTRWRVGKGQAGLVHMCYKQARGSRG